MLAGIFKKDLRRESCVLIRGYGWDEQNMLKKNLPETPILVGEDRVRSAHKAIKLYGSTAVILDDGFQYWELERDLNIVLVDARDPFGNGYLFPRGVLREPKSAIKRADVIVFTKMNRANTDAESLRSTFRAIKSDLVFLEAYHKPVNFYETRTGKLLGLGHVKDKRVILLSSIGDPKYFEETVKALGANVIEHIDFPDHHNFTKRDVEWIVKRCEERSFDMIVTTEKDSVKMNRLKVFVGEYTLVTLAIEMEILKGKEELVARLNSLFAR
jgi:tetraacyldisaccharide 4'-kinase